MAILKIRGVYYMKDFKLIIVTGMSGAGKTLACRSLEDLDYFCVDNLPPMLIPKFVELCSHSSDHMQKFVLVVDARSKDFFETFMQVLDEIDEQNVPYQLLFMDASDAVIIRRYKETRRRHPMDPNALVSDAIKQERKALDKIKQRATHIIDTSNLKSGELKERITKMFKTNDSGRMNINILSFGFKFGVPLESDLIFDVRFLPNPFYDEKLRYKSGNVADVAKYIDSFDITKQFKEKLDDFIDFLVPQYINEGKSQLVISVGCTGGMHRSVFIAHHIYKLLKDKDYLVNIEHRDLMKNKVEEHIADEDIAD